MRTVLIVSVALGVIGAFADDQWTLNSDTPTWWFEPAAWSNGTYPQSGESVIIGASSDNAKANVYLQSGDVVSGIADLTFGKNTGAQTHLTIPTGASLTFTNTMRLMGQSVQKATGLVEITGGTLKGKAFNWGGHTSSKGTVRITNNGRAEFTSCTSGWLGPSDFEIDTGHLCVGSGNFLFGNRTDAYARLFGRNATIETTAGIFSIGANVSGALGAWFLEDSAVTVSGSGGIVLGRASQSCLRITNTVVRFTHASAPFTLGQDTNNTVTAGVWSDFEMVGENAMVSNSYRLKLFNNARYIQRGGQTILRANNTGDQIEINGVPGTEQLVEVHGGTFSLTNANPNGDARIILGGSARAMFRQTDGTVTAPGILFKPCGPDNARYEMTGGTLELDDSKGGNGGIRTSDKSTRAGTFSIIGGSPNIRMTRIGTYNSTDYQPMIEYVICTNFVAPICFSRPSQSYYSWVSGIYTIVPQGGMQLIHTNTVMLLDGRGGEFGILPQNPGSGGTFLPNPALWESGTTDLYGGSKADRLGSRLLASAAFESGAAPATPVSCGFLKLPKTSQKGYTVWLNLLPQNEVTIAELVADLTAAGYPAQADASREGYNVRAAIPENLVAHGSDDEYLVFDFARHMTPEDVRNGTPTVRALVGRVLAEKRTGGFAILIN
ncbi:MAG TPA: hypothetical protein PLH01_00500 [Kiritimatiellia bacterium]|nr:hypothetical protein [Kiritimatiellia bacterium]